MLEAFKKGQSRPAQQQALELETLIATSREERAALSTMLTQIQLQSSKLAAAGKALHDVEQLVTDANARIDQVSERLKTAETRSSELEAIDGRIRVLLESLTRAEQDVTALVGPDSRLQQHREAIQGLAVQAEEARASLESLKTEHAGVEQIRADVQRSATEAADAARSTAAMKEKIAEIEALSSTLSSQLEEMESAAAKTHKRTAATADTVRDVERRLGVLPQLQEMSRATEERLTGLNALAEHVSQKVKVLENQKHTVERAVIESNRLNEMIWNMELQIKNLEEAARRATATEEIVEQVEKVSRDISAQLETGLRARDDFAREIQHLEKAGTSLADVVRTQVDRIEVERRQLNAFDERVKALHASITTIEQSVASLARGENRIDAINARVDQLSRDIDAFSERAEGALGRQTALEALHESLQQVDALTRSTAARFEALSSSRQHLDRMREEMDGFRATYTDAVRLRDSLNADRQSLEAFLGRIQEFSGGIPDLQSRMGALTARLGTLEGANRKAVELAAIADDLEARAGRLGAQKQLVEQVERRLAKLNELADDTDRKLREQHARRAEVNALETEIDGVAVRVAEAKQKLSDVATLEDLLTPLVGRVSALEQTVSASLKRVETLRVADAELAGQERRLADVLVETERAAAAAAERVAQVHAAGAQLDKAQAARDELLGELERMEAKQKEVTVQIDSADEQLQRLHETAARAEARRTELVNVDKRIGDFQSRLKELHGLTHDVDRRVQELGQRQGIVDAVRRQVDAVHEVGAKSRADLEFVEAHRNEMATLRERVDELLACIDETETRLASIHGRRQLVDEVQVKTSVILNMLEDVRLNVETLGEQRAVMDHAIESCTRLGEMVREAQSTMQGLQTERELAERIQKGIRQLRARTVSEEKKQLA